MVLTVVATTGELERGSQWFTVIDGAANLNSPIIILQVERLNPGLLQAPELFKE